MIQASWTRAWSHEPRALAESETVTLLWASGLRPETLAELGGWDGCYAALSQQGERRLRASWR